MPARTLLLFASAALVLVSLTAILFFLTELSQGQNQSKLAKIDTTSEFDGSIQSTTAPTVVIKATPTPAVTQANTPVSVRPVLITNSTTSLNSGTYFHEASDRWIDGVPPTPSVRFRGDDPRLYIETRDCLIRHSEYRFERGSVIDTDRWADTLHQSGTWRRMRLSDGLSGLYSLNSLRDLSHLTGSGIILTMGKGELELTDCGDFERLPDLEVAEVLTENGVYLTAVRAADQEVVVSITPDYHKISGLIERGVYTNSRWSEYSLCMVYRVREYPGVSKWILLGQGRQYIHIDKDWKGFATAGCGEWRRVSTTGTGSSHLILDMAQDTTPQESVWEYCARVGAKELTGSDLPDQVASDLVKITFHPMNGITGDYIYKARCGFVEGDDVATVLICQPHSWAGMPEIKWSPPTMGNMPPRLPCLAHPYQVGDLVTDLFTPDVIAEVCEGEGRASGGVFHYGKGCKGAHADYLRTEEPAYVDWGHFAHSALEQISSRFIGSYVFGEYLHLESLGAIDRSGYFSELWFPLPEGCLGFESHEVGRGSYFGGYTEPQFFKIRDKCMPSGASNTEVAWVIPEGRVKLPDSILEVTKN